MRRNVMLVGLLAAVAMGCRPRGRQSTGYRVPSPAFSIEPAAPLDALGAVSTFTFDSRGRPVVVKEPNGLATLLLDNNGDGFFETERVIATGVRALRGLWFDGRMLYLLGSDAAGQYGLYRAEDRDGNDEMERAELLAPLDAPAPGPHTIGRGPQGAPTFLHGGHWLRWNEERHSLFAVATGFANARTLAFDAAGEAFVLDAGSTEDSPLPGQPRPVPPRLIHTIPGGDYSGPGERLDTLPALAGPAGTAFVFYAHEVYPEAFRNALFAAEGAPGRIVARRLQRAGASYEQDRVMPVFEFQAAAAAPITTLATGPDGFVYFSAAGKGGGGGLYRIRYTPGWRERWERWRGRATGLGAVVRQPEPLSSWGHAALARQHDYLEARWGEELEDVARQAGASATDRVQAILLLLRFGPKPKPALLTELLGSADPRVRAAAMLAAGALGNSSAAELVAAGLKDPDPLVRRRAAEAVSPQVEADPYELLADPDRLVRFAARRALEQRPREEWRARARAEAKPRAMLEAMLALIPAPGSVGGAPDAGDREAVVERLLPMIADAGRDERERLDAAHVFALAWDTDADADLARRCAETLGSAFQAAGGKEALQLGLATALGRCGGADAIETLLAAMEPASREQPLQRHYARCLSEIRRGWNAASKEAMLAWFAQAAEWRTGGAGAGFHRVLSQWFDAFTGSALTRSEARLARRRIPKLAGAVASAFTAEEILEAQLSETAAVTGAAEQGSGVFAQRCAACHRLGNGGDNQVGPDLTGTAERLGKAALLEAILFPSRQVEERYRSEEFKLADGSTIEAMVIREDAKVLLLRTANQPRPISIFRHRVKGRRVLEESIMPEGLLDGLDQKAIAGLLAFLAAEAPR